MDFFAWVVLTCFAGGLAQRFADAVFGSSLGVRICRLPRKSTVGLLHSGTNVDSSKSRKRSAGIGQRGAHAYRVFARECDD
jgi:hypothetical protein